MGLFSRKDKDGGWDEDAAVEFHNKAPAAKISDIPASKVGNLYKEPDIPNRPFTEQEATTIEEAVRKSVDPPPRMVNSATQPKKVIPQSVEPTSQPETPATQSEAPTRKSETPSPQSVEVTPLPVAENTDQQKDEVASAEVGDSAIYISMINDSIKNLKTEMEKLKGTKYRVEDELRILKNEMDELELQTHEFEVTLRENVDIMNVEITREFVAGVEAVEIPQFEGVGDLSGVIEKVVGLYADMLPALEKSKENAANMLETLVPESNMYLQTKDLLEFCHNGIEKTEEFISTQNSLRNDLLKVIDNSDSLPGKYERAQTVNKANLLKINTMADAIHATTDEIQQLSSDLEDIRWSSVD